MNKMDAIKNCRLLSGLDGEELSEFSGLFAGVKYGKDEAIFSEGADASAFFLLVDGKVNLVKTSASGKEVLVREVLPSEVFAEAAMFSGSLYPVTAIATESVLAIKIDKERFLSFLGHHPKAALSMLGVMSKLLRHLNKLVSDISFGTVESRLASYIITRAQETGQNSFVLPIQKKQLAFRLGITPEALSRNFAKLVKAGAIAIKKDLITIRRKDRLEELSGLEI